jgi:LysR family transcriptional regulator, low CO2-responsive transcriptional regulator
MSLIKSATLRQITTFRAVARLASVSKAAEELHLSQSAVSIQIGTLEDAAGTPLVHRTGRGVRLTEAGSALLIYADRLLALWHETSDEMATFLGDFSGTLRLGVVSTAEYWLPGLLVRFVNLNPRVKVNLHVANRNEVVRSLAAQEIDLAVMGQPPAELHVESARIGINPMAFVAASHSPLAAKSDLSFAQLAQERFLVRELGSGTRNSVERLFKDAGQRLRVGSEMSSNEAIKQMCAAGFGPAFLSLHTCVLELQAGLLKLLALPKNPIERDWYVVRVGARPLPNVALAFEQFLRQDAQREAIGAQWQHALAPKTPSRPRPRAPRRPTDGVAARAGRS